LSETERKNPKRARKKKNNEKTRKKHIVLGVGGEKKGAAFSWPTEKNTKKKIKKNVKNLT
jgi:hypothetical protein